MPEKELHVAIRVEPKHRRKAMKVVRRVLREYWNQAFTGTHVSTHVRNKNDKSVGIVSIWSDELSGIDIGSPKNANDFKSNKCCRTCYSMHDCGWCELHEHGVEAIELDDTVCSEWESKEGYCSKDTETIENEIVGSTEKPEDEERIVRCHTCNFIRANNWCALRQFSVEMLPCPQWEPKKMCDKMTGVIKELETSAIVNYPEDAPDIAYQRTIVALIEYQYKQFRRGGLSKGSIQIAGENYMKYDFYLLSGEARIDSKRYRFLIQLD